MQSGKDIYVHMKFEPYPIQRVAIDHAIAWFEQASQAAKKLYAGPTGIGKSVVELLVQRYFGCDALYIVTPRDEIVRGMLDKLEAPDDAAGEAYGIWTPVRLRNRLLDGRVAYPTRVVFDEAHHHSANTWQELDLLSGLAPAVAYTATPYRGSPRATKLFRERWGQPQWIATYQEAMELGYIRMPTMEVLPLVDDDVVDVQGGEFVVTSLEAATVDRLGDLADHCKEHYCPDGTWDRATVFSVPSSGLVARMMHEFAERGMPLARVDAGTPKSTRWPVFRAVEQCVLALVHINVVGEGVDLKLRRYVDLDPTLSPVEWVQKLGRIMRPGEDDPPHYVCTNRNILRHAYVLEGVVPISAVVETERKFGPTQRAQSRALGLEAIGRFKPTTARLLNGAQLYVYSLSVPIGATVIEYCCLVHPTIEPIWASKVNVRGEDGAKQYGSWTRCDPPNDLRGFASIGGRQPTERQLNWWNRAAQRHGLDPEQEVTRKSFQALPVLSDLELRFT